MGVLFVPDLLLDIVIYGLGEVVLSADNGIALFQNVKLDKPQPALSALFQGHVPVFVDSPLSKGHAARLSLGYQLAQDRFAILHMRHGLTMRQIRK